MLGAMGNALATSCITWVNGSCMATDGTPPFPCLVRNRGTCVDPASAIRASHMHLGGRLLSSHGRRSARAWRESAARVWSSCSNHDTHISRASLPLIVLRTDQPQHMRRIFVAMGNAVTTSCITWVNGLCVTPRAALPSAPSPMSGANQRLACELASTILASHILCLLSSW